MMRPMRETPWQSSLTRLPLCPWKAAGGQGFLSECEEGSGGTHVAHRRCQLCAWRVTGSESPRDFRSGMKGWD